MNLKQIKSKFNRWVRTSLFLDYSFNLLLIYLFWLIIVAIVGIIAIVVSFAIFANQPQIASALIALFGVLLGLSIQFLINASNGRRQLRQKSIEKITDDYEKIIHILRLQENLSYHEVCNFLADFEKNFMLTDLVKL